MEFYSVLHGRKINTVDYLEHVPKAKLGADSTMLWIWSTSGKLVILDARMDLNTAELGRKSAEVLKRLEWCGSSSILEKYKNHSFFFFSSLLRTTSCDCNSHKTYEKMYTITCGKYSRGTKTLFLHFKCMTFRDKHLCFCTAQEQTVPVTAALFHDI